MNHPIDTVSETNHHHQETDRYSHLCHWREHEQKIELFLMTATHHKFVYIIHRLVKIVQSLLLFSRIGFVYLVHEHHVKVCLDQSGLFFVKCVWLAKFEKTL